VLRPVVLHQRRQRPPESERQRANIQRICDREGWIPEWYEDADGHKSGRYVKNRPGWQQLEKRLKDPDIVGLVSNDSGRMHRKTWRVGYLLDQLDEYGLRLIMALQDREYDTSDPMDRLLLTFMAFQDEAYANDIAAKAKDSINYRKSLAKPSECRLSALSATNRVISSPHPTAHGCSRMVLPTRRGRAGTAR